MSILQSAKTWELKELVRAYEDIIKHLSNGFVVSKDLVEYYQNRLDDVNEELNKRK